MFLFYSPPAGDIIKTDRSDLHWPSSAAGSISLRCVVGSVTLQIYQAITS